MAVDNVMRYARGHDCNTKHAHVCNSAAVEFSHSTLAAPGTDGVRYGHILDPRTGWPVATPWLGYGGCQRLRASARWSTSRSNGLLTKTGRLMCELALGMVDLILCIAK